MNIRFINMLIVMAMILLAGWQRGAGSAVQAAGSLLDDQQQQSQVCMRQFEMTVRQGPSAGLQLAGTLVLNVEPSGSINKGSLVLESGGEVRVTGQVTGRAINLLFDIGDGRLLFGVGTLENYISLCTGAMGGPLVGPRPGDLGDWAASDGQIIIDSQGRIFSAEFSRHDIRFQASFAAAQERFAGIRDVPGLVNGTRLQAQFNRPFGMAIDETRNLLYVADTVNQSLRRINLSTNQVTTVITSAQASAAGSVSVFGIRGVAVDLDGSLFISDYTNSVVWFFNTSTGNLRIIAGRAGMPGLQDGIGSAARFNKPEGVRIDSSGRNAIVSDPGNCAIRLVSSTGVVQTIGSTTCGTNP